MLSITGELMSEDKVIATVKNGVITDCNETLLPLYLKRTKNLEGWLASRAIDTHRTNSRLLKKALRLRTADDAQIALAVNAATVTDRYWFRPEESTASYEDIRFKENYFDSLALRGDPNGFSHKPSRTPELTNTGSYEKCWRLIDGAWWMYKSGTPNEYFSELFISRLGEKLGFDMVHYELDDGYIRSKNFTDGTSYNFEPMSSLVGENDDYSVCFDETACAITWIGTRKTSDSCVTLTRERSSPWRRTMTTTSRSYPADIRTVPTVSTTELSDFSVILSKAIPRQSQCCKKWSCRRSLKK